MNERRKNKPLIHLFRTPLGFHLYDVNRQESWWRDSLLMIVQNQISCVRVTHIRNTTSDYPAAYLIIERI